MSFFFGIGTKQNVFPKILEKFLVWVFLNLLTIYTTLNYKLVPPCFNESIHTLSARIPKAGPLMYLKNYKPDACNATKKFLSYEDNVSTIQ